jgi:dihydrofolate synthase/folylpolyglutamate synthase
MMTPMQKKSYADCLTLMFRLHRFGIKLELSTIQQILAGLQNPQDQFRTIHIAGTNGKGSVAAMLSTILRQAGYKVGLYTSPHLERFNERICINNQPIADDEVVALYEAVNQAQPGTRHPTFFEFSTAMALLHFGRQQVDWAVIETGMGGRMDATNLIHPDLTIITNISLEHKAYLGSTIAAIAGEKAGIIKRHTPVVTAVQQPSARQVIENRAATLEAPLYIKGKAFRTRTHIDGSFSYYGINQNWPKCTLGLQGQHQTANASIVLAACEILQNANALQLNESHIRSGLIQTRWPGRLEVISTQPYIILDGAHNLMAARALTDHLRHHFSKQAVTLVVGILDDKPYRPMLQMLAGVCGRVIVTRPVIDRALPAETLASEAQKWWPQVIVEPTVDLAIRRAVNTCNTGEVICVAGSLYVVGEAKTALGQIGIHGAVND